MADRSFDSLTECFSDKIHNSIKGRIRREIIWQDLNDIVLSADTKPLQVLDIGGGLGYYSTALARKGHNVTYNDLSQDMTNSAQTSADEAGVKDKICWHTGSYESLLATATSFDLILCHAVVEWLENPEKLFSNIPKLMHQNSILSLCFYNPVGKIYRNLIRGNFHSIRGSSRVRKTKRTFTPQSPCSIEQVSSWLSKNNLDIIMQSGIRVFSDYVVEKRGGLAIDEEVIAMEKEFSRKSPYRNMGRYIHIVAGSVSKPLNEMD